ncbi:acetamidase [Rhizocola hellebori]|uniref:Acetamidase n=1 Tax=Rhizocola hellebori TaxID=1392758 RepID=A0A8J3Q213_9ACTN|nr:acetamidase/formamidase family protein [Rhizocola hellebori]GIH02029.1 acetamidase [Rhizocola hellebori]
MDYTLSPDDQTLHGYFSPGYQPVLTIDSADTVTFSTLDCWWSAGPYAGEKRGERPRVPQHREGFGHALTGPIAINGARAGMTLAIEIGAVVPAPWGTTVAGGWPSKFNAKYDTENTEGVAHAWQLDAETMTGRNQLGHTVALRPFMGVMGMPPAVEGEHSTIPPRWHGGNLDCKELVAGTTLLLPIPVDGALFSVGDGHAAQGDGEVCGTAIECPMQTVTLTFRVRDDFAITGPVARIDGGWLTMGLGDTLDEATYVALEAMFALLHRLHGLSRPDAIAIASIVVDLRITQIVNQVVGVHAVLRDDALGIAPVG